MPVVEQSDNDGDHVVLPDFRFTVKLLHDGAEVKEERK